MTMTDPASSEATPLAKKGGTATSLAMVRVNHALKLLRYRHPDGLPGDADGFEMLGACVRLAAHLSKERAAKLAEIYRLAPWASEERRDELERRALAEKWWPSIDELGALFKVTREERHGLETWQLGAIGETPEDRAKNERDKHRDRQREARRQKRADRGVKPSAADREARLLEELPHAPIAITELASRVRHLPEFKKVKNIAGAVHRAADALKARGLLVDQGERQGRKPIRLVRRARETDRYYAAAPKIATAAAPRALVQQDDATGYLERLKARLQDFSRDDVSRMSTWFASPEERGIRARCRLTAEQFSEALDMLDGRATELLGRKVFFQRKRSS